MRIIVFIDTYFNFQAVMVSHGNIISNLNKSEFRSGFGPNSVSVHLLGWTMRSVLTADWKCATG
jgi:hypothetical protein